MKEVITYAQNREDIIIQSFFSDVKKGFYVDIGANDPVNDSVTKFFYDKGWSGVNVEPIKTVFDKLNKNRKRDVNLNIGISSRAGKLTLREYENTGISTFSDGEKKKKHIDKYKDYEVEVQTLDWIFKNHVKSRVNFLKIDVEGYEYEVIKGNNWTEFRPELVCVEANHINKDWRPILASNKYKKVFFDGLNEYYLTEESQRWDIFKQAYPEMLISGPMISADTKNIIENLSERLEEIHQQLIKESKITLQLENKLKQFDSIRFTAKQLKQLLANKIKG